MPLEHKEKSGPEEYPEDFYEYENSSADPDRNNLNLGKSQKIAAIILAVFAFGVIVAWGMQVKNNINGPFAYKPTTDSGADSGQQADGQSDLKSKDTDGDGISDYDELNIYQTSPYLEDSDSDGYSDKQEIESKNDPGCPEGRICESGIIADDSGAESAGGEITSTSTKKNTAGSSAVSSGQPKIFDESKFNNTSSPLNINNDKALQGFISGNLDAKSLRAMLIESGFDGVALGKISDAELIQIYENTFKQ